MGLQDLGPGLGETRAEAAPSPCRCTRRTECPRAEETGHWLWSWDKTCVTVADVQPQNMSRRAQGEVHTGLWGGWGAGVGQGWR